MTGLIFETVKEGNKTQILWYKNLVYFDIIFKHLIIGRYIVIFFPMFRNVSNIPFENVYGVRYQDIDSPSILSAYS